MKFRVHILQRVKENILPGRFIGEIETLYFPAIGKSITVKNRKYTVKTIDFNESGDRKILVS